jgi:hypothetical protein
MIVQPSYIPRSPYLHYPSPRSTTRSLDPVGTLTFDTFNFSPQSPFIGRSSPIVPLQPYPQLPLRDYAIPFYPPHLNPSFLPVAEHYPLEPSSPFLPDEFPYRESLLCIKNPPPTTSSDVYVCATYHCLEIFNSTTVR